MASRLRVVLVGGDELALDVLRELRAAGDDVDLLWRSPCRIAEEAIRLGARHRDADPELLATWERLALSEGTVVACISQADDFNLTVGLLAREAHPHVRLILRQFDRRMAGELERILPNAGVVAIADVAAATYAASVLDPHIVSAFRFPEANDALLAFAAGMAQDFGCAGMEPRAAAEHLRGRLMEVNGHAPREQPLETGDELVVFAPVARLAQIARARKPRGAARRRRRNVVRSLLSRLDPVTLSVGLATVLLFLVAAIFYGAQLGLTPLEALYVVTSRIAENGDVSLWRTSPGVEAFTIVVMLSGIALTGSVVALFTNAVVRRREEMVAGLRRVYARNHIVVCGSGVVGSRVVEYLLALGVPVVIVERKPDPALVAQARERGARVITGDATREQTLEYAGVESALGVVALAADDATNLKIALTARALKHDAHIVLRFNNASLGRAVERHLGAGTVHALRDLAAPLVAERVAGHDVLDRVRVHGTPWAVVRRDRTGLPPLCGARDGRPVVYRAGEEQQPGDVVLSLAESRG
ncbi:MAG TPA: NAD-binding protein [Candidatus Dormibacteraeota bacterium]|nr:NAD-binding protein [Candidatus Dormibacteraeota bacterium]